MVYLLGIVVVVDALRVRAVARSPRCSASLAFDFFFVPPYFSFAVSDLQHIVTFGVMFLVAVVISQPDASASATRPTARAAASGARRASTP